MKRILNKDQFDINEDFVLIMNHKSHGVHNYSTPQTIIDLEYSAEDVVNRLRELSVNEYHETLLDKDNTNPPFLFVFAKNINNHQVYIKLKIKNTGKHMKQVLCVSFHYAQYEIKAFPYA